MITRERKDVLVAVLLGIAALFAAACGANDSILRSGKEPTVQPNTASTPERSNFDKDLEAMRIAGFTYIYVLRRKDRGVIDPEDKSVIRVQTSQANRRVSSDDGKAVIIGSNFQIAPHNMAAIYQRFAVENYSPAPGEPPTVMQPDTANTSVR